MEFYDFFTKAKPIRIKRERLERYLNFHASQIEIIKGEISELNKKGRLNVDQVLHSQLFN